MGRLIKKTRKHQIKSLVKGGKKKRGGSKKVIQKKKRVSRKGRMLGGNLHDDLSKKTTDEIIKSIRNEKTTPKNVNKPHGYRNETPLHTICALDREGNIKIVEALLEKGATIDARNREQQTPLHYACFFGHLNVAMTLIDNGADIHAIDDDGNTPLHLAINHNRAHVAIALIERGAQINIKNSSLITPLHLASDTIEESPPFVNLFDKLLERGAQVNELDDNGNTPLHMACSKGNEQIVESLIKNGAVVNNQNNREQTPLYIAVLYGYEKIIPVLIKNGANIDMADSSQDTPLHVASGQGDTDIVNILIDNGAAIDARDSFQNTPLHRALNLGGRFNNDNKEVAIALIKRGADVYAENNSGNTPSCDEDMKTLFNRLWRSNDIVAAMHIGDMHIGDMGTFEALLKDYPVNGPVNDDGWTILHVAASLNRNVNRMNYVDLILKSGLVDVDAKTNDGKTALMIANERGDVELVKRLGVSKKRK
jgi:ankyrin repeat protein